jgi:hypothetical protein
MNESIRRRLSISAVQSHRQKRQRDTDASVALSSLLEGLARACYEYRAALSSGNGRWIREAHDRWIVARDVIQRILDTQAA